MVTQLLEISTPSPKRLEYLSHSLTYEVTQPIKTNQLIFRAPFTFWDAHAPVIFPVSLNRFLNF